MTEPIALDRARSLYAHAKHSGEPLESFEVLIDKREGWELLEWFLQDLSPSPELNRDLLLARSSDDPWIILEHFVLLGLKITKRETVQ